MVKKDSSKIIAPFFLIIAILLVGFIYQFNKDELQDIRSKALFEDDPNFCINECIGKDRCGNGPAGDIYNDPCCKEIKKTGDPMACGWPERGYCTDDQCASIPEGVNRQRCGGPRHSWCNECISHNCPGYGSSPIQPTAAPTSIPIPTIETPTTAAVPTETPVPLEPTAPALPTEIIQIPRPQITYIPIRYPTNPPSPVPTATPIPISWSNIFSPKVLIQTFRDTLNFILPSMTFTPKSSETDNYPSPVPQISGSLTISPTKSLLPEKEVKSFFDTTKSNLQDFFSKILP